MTVSEMRAAVRLQLNESGTEFFSDDDIAEAVQEGLDEMAEISEYSERYANIRMKAGRTYYDLSTILPDTFLSPRRIWSATSQWWLDPLTPRDLDEGGFRQWETTQSEPRKYMFRGDWWLGVWPKPTQDGGVLRFVYTDIPAALGVSETPSFPVEYQRGVIDFATSDLLSQQRETQKAVMYWNSFMERAEGLKQYAQERQRLARRDSL